MSTAHDPLAPYRKTPVASAGVTVPPQTPDEYEAFAAKDKVSRLRIRRVGAPVNAPGYNILLNVIYDREGTNFILVYSILKVLVTGRNLQNVIFAIENHLADFIQEFDPKQWKKPGDVNAPFIEVIVIDAVEDETEPKATRH